MESSTSPPPQRYLIPSNEFTTDQETLGLVYSTSSPNYPSSTSRHGDWQKSAYEGLPPPGFARAEMLSGATVRLTYITPRFISWAPGQHFLLNIPSISKTATHPFTTASVCDEQASTKECRNVLVFLIRSKDGWTRNLWEHVSEHCTQDGNRRDALNPDTTATTKPEHSVLMRMYVEGPFGSSARARWESHSTVLIIVGGSGVSFGLSVLEYACLCLSGHDGRFLGGRSSSLSRQKGLRLRRVRFVWLIREFANTLDVQIFVTNYRPSPRSGPSTLLSSEPLANTPVGMPLLPPSPHFTQNIGPRHVSDSSMNSINSVVDVNTPTTEFGDEQRAPNSIIGEATEDYTIHLTNFEGDDETVLPGEKTLNVRVEAAGKFRRSRSRKAHKSPPNQKDDVAPQKYHYVRASQLHIHNENQSRDALHTFPWQSDPSLPTEQWSSEASLQPSPRFPAGIPVDESSKQSPHDDAMALRVREGSPRNRRPTISPSRMVTRIETSLDTNEDDAIHIMKSIRDQVLESKDGRKRPLYVEERDMQDMAFVAEHTRLGKPRIHRIVGDEVRRARGSVIVACCGPMSLNAMVRKAVASEIVPGRVRRGEHTEYIELVSEEFEY
ncbi:hypothetical protein D9615_003983 [Tricholomella constricta]|uniref:ferric-chelate reductase (NADPH) n=1 Tax=Tricholomella constricta TaxID=117010 RepID=A0A8H5M4Z5_9AGAR|nr:hypothetical protein D9615_003983 [Tricholomella constricta]